MCNANNHPPGCNCGWGGGWHAGRYASSNSYTPPVSYPQTYRWPHKEEDFCSPTTCPICGTSVYFVRHNGGNVWLDNLGQPWPKHPCFDDDVYSTGLTQKLIDSASDTFGVVIEVEPKIPYIQGRIVIRCNNGSIIDAIFNFADDITLWLGKLVIVDKKDGSITLIIAHE